MKKTTIALSINATWNIVNFRSGLVKALHLRGYRVVAISPSDAYVERLAELNVDHFPIAIDNQGISPLNDFRLLTAYFRLLRRIKPDVFLGYTAKPNIYGSMACHLLGIAVINNISGLGTTFIRRNILTKVVTNLYRMALRRSATVFFQNDEDLDFFVASKLVQANQARLLAGSGIDLERFRPSQSDAPDAGGLKFLLIGRLLWDKGVGEYVAAARLVRREFPAARFQVLGFVDVANRTAVKKAELESWVAEGLLEFLGHADDVRPFIRQADCVVLPSYREGLPRSLLEAAAMAKPLIATDVPGCRHVVEDGGNGFLCTVKDPHSLAQAMLRMLRLSSEERSRMGQAGRAKMEAEFDEKLVIDRYVQAVEDALAGAQSADR